MINNKITLHNNNQWCSIHLIIIKDYQLELDILLYNTVKYNEIATYQ